MSEPKEMTPERLALFRKRLADYEDDPNPNPADAVIRDLITHADALAARLEAAERTINSILARNPIALIGNGDMADAGWVLMESETFERVRADAAEKKLQVLVKAWDELCAANAARSPTGPQACRDAVPVARDRFHAAIGEARGES